MEAVGPRGPARVVPGRMAVERRSDFQCCMIHRRWVRGVRAKVNSGHGSGQQGVGVGHGPGHPVSRYPARPLEFPRTLPGEGLPWTSPRALGSCPQLATAPAPGALVLGQWRSLWACAAPSGRQCYSFRALLCYVLQGCRWSVVDRQCLAKPLSALTQEVQPATRQKGRKRGGQKPRTRPSETFL